MLPRATPPPPRRRGSAVTTHTSRSRRRLEDRQRVGLRVEDPLVQRHEFRLGFKEQKEVLERLAQEEALHLVAVADRDVLDGVQRRISPAFNPRVLLKRLENGPSPLDIFAVSSQPVHDEEAFDRLGPQQVVRVLLLDDEVRPGTIRVEESDFGREVGRHRRVHLIARLDQILGKVHVGLWVTVCRAEGQQPWEEAHQVIHLGAHAPVDQLGNVREVVGLGPVHKPLEDPIDRFGVHLLPPGVRLARLQPLLEQVLVVRVAAGPEGDGAGPEVARVGVDPDGHQPVFLREAPHVVHHLIDRRGVFWVAADAGQFAKLQLDRRHLGRRRVWSPLGLVRVQGPDVDVRVWHLRRRIKGMHQPVAEVDRLCFEQLVAGERVH
mmetsp:Transcript_21388/g.63703  ORF Transcript_21388/g.63703 Transcript_21388/m.63703 type:complete len:379 (-) Transcript_21388:295-1431(-)